MAEFIVSGPSTPERLESAGMEVIVRCEDCGKCSKNNKVLLTCPPQYISEYWCRHFETYVDPDNHCSWGMLRR